jgi:hypothetical protein
MCRNNLKKKMFLLKRDKGKNKFLEYSNLHLQPPCGSESVGTYIGSAPRIETAARDKAISFLKNKKTKLDECQKSVAIYTERKKKPWTFFFSPSPSGVHDSRA